MSKISVGYYPGCSGLGTSMEYDLSTRSICEALNIELKEIPDWTCCGSTPAHTVDHVLSTAISARNFAQAEEADIEDVATPCPSCLKNLRTALDSMEDDFFRARVDALTERPLKTPHTVKSMLQILVEDLGLDEIKKRVVRPLTGLKIVPYYGCLMSRPTELMRFDNPENPMALDNIMEALGATVLPYPFKTECCGASFAIPERDIVPRLGGRLLGMAADLGADCVVVACPLCQMNLDLRQGQIKRANKGSNYSLPVPYFTQLMAYAMGLDDKKIGFNKLVLDVRPLLRDVEKRIEDEAKKAAQEEAAKKEAATQSAAGGQA